MIDFACPACGNSVAVEEKYVGRKGTCKQCGNVAVVPSPVTAVAIHSLASVPDMRSATTRLCPKCEGEIPRRALRCKHCGYDMEEEQAKVEQAVWEGGPSLWNYSGVAAACILFGMLLLFPLLFLPLIFVHWKMQSYRVTTTRIISHTGMMNRKLSEIAVKDLRAIEVTRSFKEMVLGLGTINFGSSGQAGYEVQFRGVRDFARVRDMVNRKKYE